MFEKILIANRGEIALRIHRACREMGIHTVAVHSTADSEAMHVRLADESVCIGPPAGKDSYLNVSALLSAANITGVDAIHPGVGFLSENADFAQMVEEHGLVFIGPEAEHISLMGDKVAAKQAAASLGIPVVPGSEGAVTSEEQAKAVAGEIGYPLLVKAAAGGGGRGMKVAQSEEELLPSLRLARAEAKAAFRGMKVAQSEEELLPSLRLARAEAKAAFGNDAVYMERYLGRPRHIEVQVLADSQGNVVHLGERDCSLQRRHQKLLEEAPSPALNAEERKAIGERVSQAMTKLGYRSAGTIEFLYEDGEFYFIEMNTRLQVEHPITEAITGVDIVREQIRIAAGIPLSVSQPDIGFSGHAIECRINAEHPLTFVPSPGLVTDYHAPGGLGVRVDSGLYSGYKVPPHYDSLIAKLIVHGQTRNECLMRLRRALEEFVIEGVHTTIPLHQALIADNDFINGDYDIHWLEHYVDGLELD
jgi:acetyl-CoA carboxylase biotin carboxylase subunit